MDPKNAEELSKSEKDNIRQIITGMPEWVYDRNGKAIDSRKKRLMDLNGGSTWFWMYNNIFWQQRYALISVIFPSNEVVNLTKSSNGTEYVDLSGSAIDIRKPSNDFSIREIPALPESQTGHNPEPAAIVENKANVGKAAVAEVVTVPAVEATPQQTANAPETVVTTESAPVETTVHSPITSPDANTTSETTTTTETNTTTQKSVSTNNNITIEKTTTTKKIPKIIEIKPPITPINQNILTTFASS